MKLILIAVAVLVLAGSLVALLFACLTVTLRTNQVIAALGINLLAVGGTGFLYRSVFGLATLTPQIHPAGAVKIPYSRLCMCVVRVYDAEMSWDGLGRSAPGQARQ